MPKYTIAVGRPTSNGWERVEIGNMLVEITANVLSHPEVQPFVIDVIHIPIQKFPTDTARNVLVKECVARGFDFLLMLDVDGSFKEGTFRALFKFIREQPEPSIVAVPYASGDGSLQVFRFSATQLRQKPLDSWAITRFDRDVAAKSTGFQRVASIGTHGMMIDCRVFAKLKKPYFRYLYNEDHTEVKETEDCWFCRQSFNAGVPIWVAWDYPANHYKEIAVPVLQPLQNDDIPEFFMRKARAELAAQSEAAQRNGKLAAPQTNGVVVEVPRLS